MSSKFSPELILLSITRDCRKELFNDVLNDIPHVYDILYSNIDSEIFNTYVELYDLFWIKLHWDKLKEYISCKRIYGIQKGKLLSFFAEWYKKLLKEFQDNNEAIFCTNVEFIDKFINIKIDVLEREIDFDKRCNKHINSIEISFKKEQKRLKDKIKKERNI